MTYLTLHSNALHWLANVFSVCDNSKQILKTFSAAENHPASPRNPPTSDKLISKKLVINSLVLHPKGPEFSLTYSNLKSTSKFHKKNISFLKYLIFALSNIPVMRPTFIVFLLFYVVG